MIFVIENYLESRRRKIEAWNNAKDRWINENSSDYSYRTEKDYEKYHPYPVTRWGKIGRASIPIILVHLIFIPLGFLIHHELTNPEPPKKPEQSIVYKDGDKCGSFKIGDIANIDYGDYQGAEVKIIGGCKDGEAYQVIVTKDQKLFGEGSQNPDLRDRDIKAGLTFDVNTDSNLTIIGHEAPEKKE